MSPVVGRVFRSILMVGGVVLAYVAFDLSMANNIRLANPALAYQLYPDDPQVLARELNRKFASEGRYDISGDDQVHIERALRKDPLNRVLVRSLAAQYDGLGKLDKAQEGMALSSAISRRDTVAQLWLGEFYLRKRKFPDALQHFDAALTVNPSAQKLVFARLLEQFGEAGFAGALRPYVQQFRPWVRPFIQTAAVDRPEQVYAASLANGKLIRTTDFEQEYVALMHNLARRGNVDMASKIALAMVPDMDLGALRSPAFSKSTLSDKLGELGWQLPYKSGIEANFLDGGEMRLVNDTDTRELAATRDILVDAGQAYVFSFSQKRDGDAGAGVTWAFQCVGPVKVVDLPAAGPADRLKSSAQSYRVVTSSDCTLLKMMLYLDGSVDGSANDITLSGLQLAKG